MDRLPMNGQTLAAAVLRRCEAEHGLWYGQQRLWFLDRRQAGRRPP